MNPQSWHITYRGSLSSCNYDCDYCPFAKTSNTRLELQEDYKSLERFVNWVHQRQQQIRILFTPWGESLVRKPYQQAMISLSHAQNISRVAIQTNLSCNLEWVKKANKSKLAIWATYHPSQTTLEKFIKKCSYLFLNNIRFSVGSVGLIQDLGLIEQLRILLPESVYLWVNAYKDKPSYYNASEVNRILKIDPLFDINNNNYESFGEACFAGETSFMVKQNGDIQRCHFIKNKLANIYDDSFEQSLKPRSCSLATCDCHIAYINLKKLNLDKVFKNGMVERIPNLKLYNTSGE